MKKLICIFMITTMLFGCSSADTEKSSVQEETTIATEATTSIEEIDWLSMSETEISDKIDSMTDAELEIVGGDITGDEMWHIREALSEEQRDRLAPYYTFIDAEEVSDISYSTVNEFKGSTFCSTMKSDGYTPYLLEYDEERYSLVRLSSEKTWYTYNLYDNIEKKNISYTIMYDSYVEKIEDFAEYSGGTSEDIITKAQRNGTEYDVYLSKTPYIEDTNYGLLYIPAEGCEACIYAYNSTSDEILEYFDDFELVAES